LAEQSGELLDAVTFLLFGAVLLGPALGELDWRVALYAVGSLTVVRMLPVVLAMLGTGMRRVRVGFLGWFGPRGLASIVFVLILVEETELPERSLMLTVVTWTVALSVYAHGLTAWPGAMTRCAPRRIEAEIHPLRVRPGRRRLGDHWWQRPCSQQGPRPARTRQARTPMTTNREGPDDAGDQATTRSALRRPT
jgi:NhaP-type Na+/H+ or K+/H+ antiporter